MSGKRSQADVWKTAPRLPAGRTCGWGAPPPLTGGTCSGMCGLGSLRRLSRREESGPKP